VSDEVRAFDLTAPAGISMASGVGEDYKELARARGPIGRKQRYLCEKLSDTVNPRRQKAARKAAEARWEKGDYDDRAV